MNHPFRASLRAPRAHPLHGALGLALALAMPGASASAPLSTAGARMTENVIPRDGTATGMHGRRARAGVASARTDARPSGAVVVENCNDAGPGSLREALDGAVDNDVVDLTNLVPCTISLEGDIFISADNLRVLGPGPGRLVVDGAQSNGMLAHLGEGTFSLEGMTIANGKYTSDHGVRGGCVYSTGNVVLTDVVVSGCATYAQGAAFAMGGGVFAFGSVTLVDSDVRNSTALAGGSGLAFGGGVYAGAGLAAFDSTISGNQAAASTPGLSSYGGGAWSVLGNNTIVDSTISGNGAAHAAGLALYGTSFQTRIVQSTVSGNRSTMGASGMHVASGNILIRNSTITANVHDVADSGIAGAGLEIPAAFDARLDGNILAGNFIDNGKYLPYDFRHGGAAVIGSSNLATSSAASLPVDTIIVDDARLGPLADNGGRTQTHAPLADSPAIGRGNNLEDLPEDQRGSPREVGRPDVGSVEFDDALFVDGFETRG